MEAFDFDYIRTPLNYSVVRMDMPIDNLKSDSYLPKKFILFASIKVL